MTIKQYHTDALHELNAKAKEADRRRANLNVHSELEAPVQRLFIATEPDTYIRPHRHPQANKWEFFMVLEGHIDLLLFDEEGRLTSRVQMTPEKCRAVEIPPGTWHTYAVQESGTLAIEVKEGPYIPTPEEDFASWSPAEGAEQANAFRDWMRVAEEGSRFEG